MNAIAGRIFRNVRSRDGEPAVRTHIATFHGNALTAERDQDTGDLHIYHIAGGGEMTSTQTIGETNKVGDGTSWWEGPEETKARRLAEMSENEREDALRRAVEQGKLSAQEAEQWRQSSVKWNAQQTQDRRRVRLAAPRSSVTPASYMKGVAAAKETLNHLCRRR